MVEVGETDPGIREDNELRTIHYGGKRSGGPALTKRLRKRDAGRGVETGLKWEEGFFITEVDRARYAA